MNSLKFHPSSSKISILLAILINIGIAITQESGSSNSTNSTKKYE